MRNTLKNVGNRLQRTVHTAVRSLAPFILEVGGLTLISAAAWTLTLSLGLLVAGLSCWVLQWRIRGAE